MSERVGRGGGDYGVEDWWGGGARGAQCPLEETERSETGGKSVAEARLPFGCWVFTSSTSAPKRFMSGCDLQSRNHGAPNVSSWGSARASYDIEDFIIIL
jgi:hypothetical protein